MVPFGRQHKIVDIVCIYTLYHDEKDIRKGIMDLPEVMILKLIYILGSGFY